VFCAAVTGGKRWKKGWWVIWGAFSDLFATPCCIFELNPIQ